MAKGMATAAMHANNHNCIHSGSRDTPGDFIRHMNPDGGDGGLVHRDATVNSTATIAYTAKVYAGANIDAGVVVGEYTEIHKALIGTNSKIGERVRIYNGVRLLADSTVDDRVTLQGKSQDIITASPPKRTVYVRREPK